jgi:hypothetical protein
MRFGWNRGVRVFGGVTTLVLCFVGAHFLFDFAAWAALILALLLAILTFLSLTAATRGAVVPGLYGRRLALYLFAMGLSMAVLAVVLPMLPDREAEAGVLSIVLIFSALLYIAAAVVEYARGGRTKA